jgi:integrase
MVWVRSPVYFYKRKDTFYFSRAVPSDLRQRFNKRKIEVSLRTKSQAKAMRSAAVLSDRLERYWDSLRMEMICSRELGLCAAPEVMAVAVQKFSLPEALALYQRLKGGEKTKLFFEGSERSMRYLIDCVGHESLTDLAPSDAGKFRDYLFDRGMASASVKRVISSVRAILNIAIKEYGLERANIFNGTFIPTDAQTKKRLPVPDDVILKVQWECQSLDDQQRWMIALISDTGMRLSEVCGLSHSDIKLDCSIPHIDLIEHPWRRLKTSSSIRKIPLVGTSLWAAGRIKSQGGEFAFSKYCDGGQCNANSASAALNKWLKPRVPQGCVIHSFRHSLRDRLREVECPADVIDAIGGWVTEGVGHQYGKGHSLKVKHGWMESLLR